jgi:hypothetical protein
MSSHHQSFVQIEKSLTCSEQLQPCRARHHQTARLEAKSAPHLFFFFSFLHIPQAFFSLFPEEKKGKQIQSMEFLGGFTLGWNH